MKRKALSFIELMVAVAILTLGLTALLASYVNMFLLIDLSRDSTRATKAIWARMEEIKKESFRNLDSFNGTIFVLDGFGADEAKGRVEIRDVSGYSNLKEIRIVGCFRSRGRIIGEDLNLNGILDISEGEDANNNLRLDSPVELITIVTD